MPLMWVPATLMLLALPAAASAQTAHGPIDPIVVERFDTGKLMGHFTAPPHDPAMGGYLYNAFEIRYSLDGPLNVDSWKEASIAVPYTSDGQPSAGDEIPFESPDVGPMGVVPFPHSDTYYFAIRYERLFYDEDGPGSDVFNFVANHDIVAPAAVTDLAAGSATPTSLSLTWTAPADDGETEGGPVDHYLMWTSSVGPGAGSIVEWIVLPTTTPLVAVPGPVEPGFTQNLTLTGLASDQPYYVGIAAFDDNGSSGPLALFSVGPTLEPSDGAKGGQDSEAGSNCSAGGPAFQGPAMLTVAVLFLVRLRAWPSSSSRSSRTSSTDR